MEQTLFDRYFRKVWIRATFSKYYGKVSNSVKGSLLIAFRYLLKPLVRIAAKNSVLFPEFSEVLRNAYVDVALKQHTGDKQSFEEISLASGVPVMEVGIALANLDAPELETIAEETSPLATILMAWHTDQEFSGPYGVLRDLEFECTDRTSKNGPSFSELVEKYCQGSSPKQLLKELLASESVVSVGNDVYRAQTRSYVPSNPLSTQNILLFARLVHNVAESAEVNLRTTSVGGKGLMERTVYTEHGITKDELKEFDKFIRPRVQSFVDDIDNWISERDKPGRQDVLRTGIGVYHFISNEDEDADLLKRLSK